MFVGASQCYYKLFSSALQRICSIPDYAVVVDKISLKEHLLRIEGRTKEMMQMILNMEAGQKNGANRNKIEVEKNLAARSEANHLDVSSRPTKRPSSTEDLLSRYFEVGATCESFMHNWSISANLKAISNALGMPYDDEVDQRVIKRAFLGVEVVSSKLGWEYWIWDQKKYELRKENFGDSKSERGCYLKINEEGQELLIGSGLLKEEQELVNRKKRKADDN